MARPVTVRRGVAVGVRIGGARWVEVSNGVFRNGGRGLLRRVGATCGLHRRSRLVGSGAAWRVEFGRGGQVLAGSVSYGMFSSGGFVKARLLVAVQACRVWTLLVLVG